jgi:hypothetical protein
VKSFKATLTAAAVVFTLYILFSLSAQNIISNSQISPHITATMLEDHAQNPTFEVELEKAKLAAIDYEPFVNSTFVLPVACL